MFSVLAAPTAGMTLAVAKDDTDEANKKLTTKLG